MEDIESFLIKARKNVYEKSNLIRFDTSSEDYIYNGVLDNKKVKYHNTCFFSNDSFCGVEAIQFEGDKWPVWALNYHAKVVQDELTEEIIEEILRPALMMIGKSKYILPVRGPSKFVKNGYRYEFKADGMFENFTGVERIYKKRKIIYELNCTSCMPKETFESFDKFYKSIK